MPNLYIIAGCNGAGKTTASYTILPEILNCKETTLATRSYVPLVKKAQEVGYKVSLLYFWLSSPTSAIERVAKRVSKGGHDIPYGKAMKNVNHIIQDPTFTEKIMTGLKKALRKLAEEAASNNESLIIGDKDGK